MKGFHFPQAEVRLLSSNPGSALLVRSTRTLSTLSSTIVGGGFGRTRAILNRHVDKDYDVRNAADDLIAYARGHGVDDEFVGLMTAVYLDEARADTCIGAELTVATIATVGLGNRTAAGVSALALPSPGTINLIILVDGHMTPGAMVNSVITATEAKSRVLSDRGIDADDGGPATGTSTDALVVACTGQGDARPYAGTATRLGWCIARSVRRAMMKTLT